jgi:small subunit ribosomal protein S20
VARKAFQEAQPVIDSMVNKGLVHRNKAARHKSRLSARVKASVKA